MKTKKWFRKNIWSCISSFIYVALFSMCTHTPPLPLLLPPPPPFPPSQSPDVAYTGDLAAHDQLLSWLQEQCVPLVREITFANGEVRQTPALCGDHQTLNYCSSRQHCSSYLWLVHQFIHYHMLFSALFLSSSRSSPLFPLLPFLLSYPGADRGGTSPSPPLLQPG